MIEVEAVIDSGDVTLSVKGHAIGSEKVCAGVSAVVQTAIVGLQQIAKAHPDHVKVSVKRVQRQQSPPKSGGL